MPGPTANPALAKLRNGDLALILGVTLMRGATVAAVTRNSGCDGIFIDLEHGVYSIAEAAEICLAGSLAGLTPFVRCRLAGLDEAARLLDNGCRGIVVPQVSDARQARDIVRAIRIPPTGARAMGGNGLGLSPGALASAEGRRRTDDDMLVAATIEDERGTANAKAIAAVEGIDIVLLGASDLSFSLGVPGDVANEAVWRAAMSVASACREHGRIFGVGGINDTALWRSYYELGARFALVGMDHNLLATACRDRVADFAGIART